MANLALSGTHRMLDPIDFEYLTKKLFEAKLRMIFIYRPLNGK